MGYLNFTNGKIPINDTNLNAMQKDLMELVFPVGSTYVTQANTNPNSILGFGTWERFKGIIALGLDENDDDLKTIGKKGGEKMHTLTLEEIPKHNHTYELRNGQNGGWTVSQCSNGEKTYDGNTGTTGGGQAHNNMQPYEVVGYMWIRRT